MHLVKLRTLHSMGYKIADLKDSRNNKRALDRLIIFEATVKAKGKEKEEEFYNKMRNK